LTELYRMQDAYVERATREWRDGAERKKLQEATGLLQTNTDGTNSSLRTATEAAESLSARIRQSGVLERMAQLETAVKEAGERLAGRWELERAAQAREREQREREAGERARAQRRCEESDALTLSFRIRGIWTKGVFPPPRNVGGSVSEARTTPSGCHPHRSKRRRGANDFACE
jgi:hypothetical protein